MNRSPSEAAAPSQGTAADILTTTKTSISPSETIPAQIRRRRAASRRMSELGDGRRDPIDRPRPRRPVVTVRTIGTNSVEFDGPGVVDAIRTIGCKSMRSRFGGGWLVPEAAAEDVLALIESRGYLVDVTM